MSGREQAVGVPVVRAGEHRDLRPRGHRARQPHRRHHRFGAGVEEGHALDAGQLVDPARRPRRRPRTSADRRAALEAPAHGRLDEVGAMAEQVDAEAHGDVEVLAAVDVGELGIPRRGRR